MPGKTLNKNNVSLLKKAYTAIKDALSSLGDDSIFEDDTTEDGKANKSVKEAKGWSTADLFAALNRELQEQVPNAYIQDIFDESVIYQQGWQGSYYQRSYSLDDTGVATFGDPVEVTRKVTYVPTSDNEVMPMATEESANVELVGDTIQLVEKAVNPSGEVMLKLISPGKGSSGFYSAEVLKQAASNRVFKKGLHNFIDHPTAQEEASRPEGSLTKLGSVLTEDAKWFDDYKGAGAGLYAKAKVVPQFSQTLDVIANDIGMSIRANGKAHVENGEVIVDSISEGKSVDYVTLPGRGGKVIALAESKGIRPQESENNQMTEQEKLELTRLRETVGTLLNERNLGTVKTLVSKALDNYPQLPTATKARLLESCSSVVPLLESGAVDAVKVKESVDSAVSSELTYLASIGYGRVSGMGSSALNESANVDPDKLLEEVDSILNSL